MALLADAVELSRGGQVHRRAGAALPYLPGVAHALEGYWRWLRAQSLCTLRACKRTTSGFDLFR